MAYLEVNNLRKTFMTPGGREVQALKEITFSLEQGEILSVIGHNGAGKTTLLACIRDPKFADTGRILINGHHNNRHDQQIVSVFQDVGQGVIGSMSALENLALVYARNKSFLWSFPEYRYKHSIEKFLKTVGLAERFYSFAHTPTSELSGGQRQQVAIAMAILRNPTVLLLDEFVANLDPAVRQDILIWTKEWIFKQKITTIMVTHDQEVANSWGDKILELCDGEMTRFEEASKVK